jgi:hypothetical protein
MTYLLSNQSGLHVTYLTPIGVVFTALMCLLLLVVPRRFSVLPILLTACYMTFGEQIIVLGLHFTILRVLVVVGYVRVMFRREYPPQNWHRLDRAVALWSVASITFFTILWGSPAATINRLGVAVDTAGLYFLFRIMIRDVSDILSACNALALSLVPLALCMGMELLSGGRNPFSVLGGVPAISEVRDGVVRCQGPFGHPILAGTFGAVWVPVYVGLWRANRNRLLAVVGLASCTAITLLAGSSGPILTYCAGLVATVMWIARKHMRTVRWATVILILGLQCFMNDPVWFIFARINVLSGSTGWHRSNLIDQTIRHFGEWWICGSKAAGEWGIYAGDITNQYILEGLDGGIITMALFVTIVVTGFSTLGRAMKQKSDNSRLPDTLIWAIGAGLFAHFMTFWSVSYFDQNVVNFYLLLAMIPVTISSPPAVSKKTRARQYNQEDWPLGAEKAPQSVGIARAGL